MSLYDELDKTQEDQGSLYEQTGVEQNKTEEYNDVLKKYQEMVQSRKESEDININDYLPSINEMIKEDCVWDVLKGIEKELSGDKSVAEDIAYYTEAPPIANPGYYEDEQCFVLRVKNKKLAVGKYDWALGNIDGDTWKFDLNQLDSGGAFTVNGKEYASYKDYAIDNQVECKNLTVRSATIDASEICHFTPIVVETRIMPIQTTYGQAMSDGCAIMAHDIKFNNSMDPMKWEVRDWEMEDRIVVYENNGTYHQVIQELSDMDFGLKINEGYKQLVLAGGGEWGSETIVDGYKAQQRARDIFENENIKDMILILDRNTVVGERVAGSGVKYYNTFFFSMANVHNLIKDVFSDKPIEYNLATSDFLPFGCDAYGRSLGNVWVKIGTKRGDTWVNVSKYIQVGTSYTDNNPTFYNTDMYGIYGGSSDAFKKWNSGSNAFRYADSLSASGEDSYIERIKLHKELTGIDFLTARDHTVLLGDTLFLIPPEAIHTSSSLDYERLPILRGKGSIMKNRTNIEEILELELYFNNEYGINGIPYHYETPSGEKLTYHMNGLRSLIAQFRVAPYLPIENHYINDVLNIEAVTLVNMSVSTVDGFPRLLKVVLTLREFNYRVFMPDLPLPDYDENSKEISQMQHIFAKCFDWELFRYYYQRGIMNGDLLSNYEFNGVAYNDMMYSNKNVYKNVDLKDSNVEFYVPDVTWLKYALQAKKTKDKYGQFLAPEMDGESGSITQFAVEMNGGIPNFDFKTLKPESAEQYSNLDDFGRCGPASAIIGKDIMPKDGEERGDISTVTPSGWNQKTYEELKTDDNSTGVVYNRCHLIGYQLTGENANKMNLITGTRFLNVGTGEKNPESPTQGGMLYYENLIADYIDANPNNHVAYMVTPVFEGTNLVASYVILEGYSIEDEGKGICFNTKLMNIQPGITIDYSNGKTEQNTSEKQEMVDMYYDYKDPRNMKFVPYLSDEEGKSVPLEVDELTFNVSNYFTETHLKAMDGYSSQYMGGSDITIELKLTLTDEYYVGALKNLTHMILGMIRNYRRVMPCFPLKVKNDYLQMIGINEVVLDNIVVSTKPGFPGVYDVGIKLTSADRAMRQREALEKASLDGMMTSSNGSDTIGNYFNLEESLAKAELYPDLDLPTIQELTDLGWRFAKWANQYRVYVDPDFYMCYSFHYASRLVKEIISNVLGRVYDAGSAAAAGEGSKQLDEDAKNFTSLKVIDNNGIAMQTSAGVIDHDGVDIDKQNGFADRYDEIIESIQKSASADNTKKAKGIKGMTVDQSKAALASLEYLTALGIENGWQISPGWYAPLCDKYINKEMEKHECSGIPREEGNDEKCSVFIEDIYDLRHRAIMLIDRILDKPLSIRSDNTFDDLKCVSRAVDAIFRNNEDGVKLLELLCPMNMENRTVGNSSQRNFKLKPEYFQKADPYCWLEGLLYALACCRSGETSYSENSDETAWTARQWIYKEGEHKAYGGPKDHVIPFAKTRQARGIAGDAIIAKSEESSIEDAVAFGAGQIQIHSINDIKNMLQPTSKIKYFNYNYKGGASEYFNNMYYKTKKAKRDRFCETGFIDPYYNFAGYRSREGKDYIEKIAKVQAANYEALLREVLVFLKRLIMDGFIFSEVDVISQDWESVLEDLLQNRYFMVDSESLSDDVKNADYYTMSKVTHSQITEDYSKSEDSSERDKAKNLMENITSSYKKLFCSRLIYPFIMAACNSSKDLLDLLNERDYHTLDTYTLTSTVGGSNNSAFNKFLNCMFGVGMISSSNILDSAETTSNTQKAFNTLMQEAFTAMSNDPRCYALHSMYDMCVNDKRGRLVRAFPCYYMFFVDEGRQIGSWKLFDNFYNMSSISNIQIVKSRKMPADTCTFTMSNMFMSYADTYDNTIYNQYVNVYGFRDVFTSIFSPREFVQTQDAINKRKQLSDTTAISPGVRIHMRMGYGADGSRLPVVFNGKVAEVNCGETMDIVAQGDGHELNNPLNTLGELTAINLDEAQSWCTLLKDVRGSLARGGQTPRNLLAKLATAEHGGAFKSIVRTVTKGRWYYDNPFGICHFGDKRFRDIFEDSEIVQNMYEVSNKTMLNGVNDLLDDMSTLNAAPTINCNIQDKTMWEIGHLCANAGDDFYFAVRDFGLRSTMCLCRANHYYAYAYEKVPENDAIVEKRKPFQQYHYYDSYNDIIYNSLKASETNMKTNAVGVWEGTDYLWGTSQQSVGPIYLDMNIYPEYQKSMMIETGLVAGGDGGIDIPLLNALAEKFNYSEYSGRVNKSLAEKVTTNALRQSVKDMYEGEICIIGDPSLKPYDRVTIMDLYEDVSGDVEVETVIHSMNIETGYTTTFIPDLIVRAEYSAQEYGYRSVTSSVALGIGGSLLLKGAVMNAGSKGAAGLLKLGEKKIVSSIAGKLGQYAATNTAKTAMTSFANSFVAQATAATEASQGAFGVSKVLRVGAIMTNPVAFASTVIAGASIYMMVQSAKEAFTRWCRNIQALTVFPITKNGRQLIAGMAGHRGSVYGYPYTKDQIDSSIQGVIMGFLGDKDAASNSVINNQIVESIGWVFGKILTDENYEITKEKWCNNLGLNPSNDIMTAEPTPTQTEQLYQFISSCVSKEYNSRAVALAAMKTKPRIKSFSTNNRTDEIYLKYQIGGVHDLDPEKLNIDEDETVALTINDLPKNDKVKALYPVEDDPDIKLAITSDVHPVIKRFTFTHSTSASTFNLKMESENTVIRYISENGKKDRDGNATKIFDLPMVQEDALLLIKLIINEENLEGKEVSFLSGTRVNDTNSWKSTGFWFSLSSNDMTALEAATKKVKAESSWLGVAKHSFDYKNTGKSIQYTVYAPVELVDIESTGEDNDE